MNFQRGQSLFELVVAIAISALIIVAIVSLTTNSIQNSNFSRNKAQASTYAQQAMEWLRGQRDGNVSAFIAFATIPAYCLQDLRDLSDSVWASRQTVDPEHYCTTKISGTVFNRWVTFSTTNPSGKTVVEADVTVSWSDSQGVHEVVSATKLADLR